MGFIKNILKKAIKRQAIANFAATRSTHAQSSEALAERVTIETQEPTNAPCAFHEQEYREALRRYDEAHADAEYQAELNRYFELLTQIKEAYSVINNTGSFVSDAGDRLIGACAEAMSIEAKIKEEREYYENHVFDMSPSCKTLAMVFEKRGEYQRAATICVYAIENGYTADGTSGGMRGRLARMIKKGNLPLTDNIKNILNL